MTHPWKDKIAEAIARWERKGFRSGVGTTDYLSDHILAAIAPDLQKMEEDLQEAREALKPFKVAIGILDDDLPPDLQCEDEYSCVDAMWAHQAPTVEDFRRAAAAYARLSGEGGA